MLQLLYQRSYLRKGSAKLFYDYPWSNLQLLWHSQLREINRLSQPCGSRSGPCTIVGTFPKICPKWPDHYHTVLLRKAFWSMLPPNLRSDPGCKNETLVFLLQEMKLNSLWWGQLSWRWAAIRAIWATAPTVRWMKSLSQFESIIKTTSMIVAYAMKHILDSNSRCSL